MSNKVEQITGSDLHFFGIKNRILAESPMAKLFGVSSTTIKDIQNRPDDPITNNRALTILFRLYEKYPHLISGLGIHEFYLKLREAGVEISPTKFSFIVGRERTAYNRWFDESKNSSSASVEIMLNAAMLEADGNVVKAWEIVTELSKIEQDAAGLSQQCREAELWDENRFRGVGKKKAGPRKRRTAEELEMDRRK